MPAWPGTLPAYPGLGGTRQQQSTLLRTETDTGPAIVRRRYTAATVNISWPLPALTGTQYAALMTFYNTTLSYGALRFDMIDPLDDSTVECRFLEPPALTAFYPASDPTKRYWGGSLVFEILP